MSGLRAAFGFLTRLPVAPDTADIDPARATPFVPVVGALVGLAVAAAYTGLAATLPRLPAAALAVCFGVLATGALHEDGLADTADALGATDRDDALRILRDPTHGTYGVLALVASFAIRVTALASLGRTVALAAMPVVHTLSRSSAIAVIAASPPLARDGLGAGFGPAARGRPFTLAVGVALLVTVGLGGSAAATWVVAALAITVAARHLAKRRFGGVNGDVAGAVEQLIETALIVMAIRWQPQPLFA